MKQYWMFTIIKLISQKVCALSFHFYNSLSQNLSYCGYAAKNVSLFCKRVSSETGKPSSYIKPKSSTYKGVTVFSSKSPKPFIVVSVIFIIAFIVVMIATGGQGFEGRWGFEF